MTTETPWLIDHSTHRPRRDFRERRAKLFLERCLRLGAASGADHGPSDAIRGAIIKIGYLWPLMKAINLVAGLLLIANRAPAFAVALLLPVTVIIVWFQIFLNPLPVPVATAALAVTCELMLLRAYAGRYAGMFINDKWSARESTR